MSYPVDVEIYLAKMREALNDEEAHQNVFEDYGIEEFQEFDDLVMLEVAAFSLDNYNRLGSPELTETQFIIAMEQSIAQYYIDSLVVEGKIEAIIDFEDDMRIKYKLVDTNEPFYNFNMN
jgi:hypothetical protein